MNKIAKANGKLWRQIRSGNAEGVRDALAEGADPNAPNGKGMPPLHHACIMRQTDIAIELMDGGADFNAINTVQDVGGQRIFLTPLCITVTTTAYSDFEEGPMLIRELVGRGANPYAATGDIHPVFGTNVTIIKTIAAALGLDFSEEIQEVYAIGKSARDRSAMQNALQNTGARSAGRRM